MGIFNFTPVHKPKKSAFNMSYSNAFTCNMGELIPAYVQEVFPSDHWKVKPTFQVRFAPMINPIYGRIDAKMEFFWIPYRLLWSGWKSFITQAPTSDYSTPPLSVPIVNFNSILDYSTPAGISVIRLADYLGASGLYANMMSTSNEGGLISQANKHITFGLSCLYFRAYNRVWNEYYRDETIDSSIFDVVDSNDYYFTSNRYGILRRRWRKDYFTSALPQPLFGADNVKVSITDSGVDKYFTIQQFRVANALEKFLYRTNIGGHRYNEFILAHFATMPDDAVIDRPVFLSQITAPVIVNSVAQTAGPSNSEAPTFDDAKGSLAGVASAVGSKFAFRMRFKEYGVILGLFSVCPQPIYTNGIRKDLLRSVQMDFPFPEFAGVGDQEIDRREIYLNIDSAKSDSEISLEAIPFGYQQRYAECKIRRDEAHGDFVLQDKLPTYTLARFFSNPPLLNSAFLEMNPRTNVFVADIDGGQMDVCQVNMYFDAKVVRPLPKFSTPTL